MLGQEKPASPANFFSGTASNVVTAMMGVNSKSGIRKALLGVAGAVFSLVLLADGAMVSANGEQASAGAGVVQAVQVSALAVYDGGARFVGNMQTLYHLARLEELVPQAEGKATRKNEKFRIFVCSEAQQVKAEAKSST